MNSEYVILMVLAAAVIGGWWWLYVQTAPNILYHIATDSPETVLYCPYQQGDVPVADSFTTPDWEGVSATGYECEACGRVHTWTWTTPVPLYAGDKLRLRFDGEGEVEERPFLGDE